MSVEFVTHTQEVAVHGTPGRRHTQHPPFIPPGYIVFEGIGQQTGFTQSFQALCTDPPTITGGYANWTKVKRPLMRAITVPDGYDPVEMKASLRFVHFTNTGDWIVEEDTTGSLEKTISALEWMAGSRFHEGPSPWVYLFTGNGGNDQGDLIPHEYHGLTWVITGLEWGESRRNRSGHRVWQEATVSLTAWSSLDQRAKQPSDTVKGGWFVSRAGRDTPLKIAQSPSSASPAGDVVGLARAILHSKRNAHIPRQRGTRGSGIYYAYRHGRKVFVPQHVGFPNFHA